MSRAACAVIAPLVLGALGLIVVAARDGSTLAYPLGTTSSTVAVVLPPGSTACQGPLSVPRSGGFDRVVMQLGTYRRAGPPLTVAVRDTLGRPIRRSKLAGGYADVDRAPRHSVQFPRLISGSRLSICIENRGRTQVAVYGSGGNATRESTATLDGAPIDRDLNLELRRPRRTYLASLDVMLRRARLWRSPRVGPLTYGLVLVTLTVLAGASLVVLVRRCSDG